jgi:hypothetical protein
MRVYVDTGIGAYVYTCIRAYVHTCIHVCMCVRYTWALACVCAVCMCLRYTARGPCLSRAGPDACMRHPPASRPRRLRVEQGQRRERASDKGGSGVCGDCVWSKASAQHAAAQGRLEPLMQRNCHAWRVARRGSHATRNCTRAAIVHGCRAAGYLGAGKGWSPRPGKAECGSKRPSAPRTRPDPGEENRRRIPAYNGVQWCRMAAASARYMRFSTPM